MKGLDQFKHPTMRTLPLVLRGASKIGWYEGSGFFVIMSKSFFFFLFFFSAIKKKKKERKKRRGIHKSFCCAEIMLASGDAAHTYTFVVARYSQLQVVADGHL